MIKADVKKRDEKGWKKLDFRYPICDEPLEKVISSVIPAKAGIQNCLKILDSGSRFACPE
ncbi:MAG: hypothetical protein NTX30_12615 [Deltaproteobacteria bacterium]|nr:hypothetical protein [Deltaproteobacteria bacterium]